MHNYLYRFLTSPDPAFQHIAVWTIVQLLECGDPQLISNICSSLLLAPHIRQLTAPRSSTPNSVGTPHSVRSSPNQETDTSEDEEEIQVLSGRILELIDRDENHSTTIAAAPSQSRSAVASLVDKASEDLWSSIQEIFAYSSHLSFVSPSQSPMVHRCRFPIRLSSPIRRSLSLPTSFFVPLYLSYTNPTCC